MASTPRQPRRTPKEPRRGSTNSTHNEGRGNTTGRTLAPDAPDSRRPDADAGSGSNAMRADAERNRARIIEAARRLYASRGLRVSMAAVAREAGVGKATLARHFTSPRELIDAVFVDRMDDYSQATQEALTVADPWDGFVGYIWAICEMQAQDRGFADLLTLTLPGTPQLERLREEALGGFLELIAKAKASGRLREDFESEDLIVLLMANAGVVSATAGASPAAWRRLVGHMLRSYAAPDAPIGATPPAPSSPELLEAMARASRAT